MEISYRSMAAKRTTKIHKAMAPARGCRWEKARVLFVLEAPAFEGWQHYKELPKSVVDGGFLVYRQYIPVYGAVYDGLQSRAVR